uniref:Uncharacterized protein n=1 Tax=Dulem virus 116 TaxID=3145593 RepID=A0AAU8AYX8_9VIRU
MITLVDAANDRVIVSGKHLFRVWDIVLTMQYFNVQANLLIFADERLFARYDNGKVIRYET